MIKKQNLSVTVAAIIAVMTFPYFSFAQVTTPSHVQKPKTLKHDTLYSSPGWRPIPNMRTRLGDVAPFENYTIRPPRGYTPAMRTRGAQTFYFWIGNTHPNGEGPQLLVETDVKFTGTTLALDTLLTQKSEELKQTYAATQIGSPQTGTLNGMRFIRAYYNGSDSKAYLHHGLVYITIDGNEVCTITADDTDPDSTITLPIMEAATRTFVKVQSSDSN